MKILFLTSNEIGNDLVKWLRLQGDKVYCQKKRLTLGVILKTKPSFIISYNYPFLIRKDILKKSPPIINLHISYLPLNRGSYPNIWSVLEDTTSGVTIHLVDEGIDTGEILAQMKVRIDFKKHTLQSSYSLLHSEIQKLFKKVWHSIKTGKIKPVKQAGRGSIHFDKDFVKISCLIGRDGWNTPVLEFKKRYEFSKH